MDITISNITVWHTLAIWTIIILSIAGIVWFKSDKGNH